MKSIIYVLLASLFFIGCDKTEKHNHYYQNKDVVAEQDIRKSLGVSTIAELGEDGTNIIIKKSALDRELLLRAQLIEQTNAPNFNGLKSRVIVFKQRGDKIHMLEATKGHTVTEDFPLNLIIASFPAEDMGDAVLIDFAEGMGQIYTQAGWRASDFDGKAYKNEFKSVPVVNTYIEEAGFTENNELLIRQVAQVPTPNGQSAVEARYYISPYRANPEFVAVKSKSFDRMGFFEVAPFLKPGGEQVIHASKFDEKKVIEFAVSANTPAEYVQAVKDGVLYWNKAFGKDIVKVKMAPEGLSAPDPTHNIIQWVNWDNAGFAYADAQMDPRTGEILNAQVYFTSAFAFGGKVRGRRLLRKLKQSMNQQQTHHSLRGFELSSLCNLATNQRLLNSLENLLADPELSEDAKVLKVSQDYIREVVAHEVGHTLGLRHNFAGSLAINHDLVERDVHFKDYFETGDASLNIVPSSSVMEYSVFEEAAMTGDLIAKAPEALEYDKKVIQSLYMGQKYANEALPLYCTDSHADHFIDCTRFDLGSHLAEYVKYEQDRILKDLPAVFIESFITAKTPGFGGDVKPVEEVPFVASKLVKELIDLRKGVHQVLGGKQKVLSVHRQYPLIDEVNAKEVRQAELDYLLKGVEASGGLAEVLRPLHPHLAHSLSDKLESLLESGDYDTGAGYSGEDFELSAEEKAFILDKGSKSFALLAKELLKAQVALNAEAKENGALPKHPISEQFATYLMGQAEHYLTKVTDKTIEAKVKIKKEEVITEVTVNLPIFKYGQSIRVQSANALDSGRADGMPTWGKTEKSQLKKALESLVAEALGEEVKFSDLKEDELSLEAGQWVAEMKALLKALS